jgi:hypothetical protein
MWRLICWTGDVGMNKALNKPFGGYSFWPGRCHEVTSVAVCIDSVFPTSPLGVKVIVTDSGTLNAVNARRLAEVLVHAADWLEATRSYCTYPVGPVVYSIGLMSHFGESEREGEYYKVGKTNDIAKRLKQIQIGSPVELVLDAYLPCTSERVAADIEAEAHNLLSDFRAKGEWFQCNPVTIHDALRGSALNNGLDVEPIVFGEGRPRNF